MRPGIACSPRLVKWVETVIYLDTHVVVWLYSKGKAAIPRIAVDAISSQEVKISPMVRLELQYLYEIGRVSTPAAVVCDELAGTLGLAMCDKAFSAVITESIKQSWTRDPFDRVIVAQAALSDSSLVTKDDIIRKQYANALWDNRWCFRIWRQVVIRIKKVVH